MQNVPRRHYRDAVRRLIINAVEDAKTCDEGRGLSATLRAVDIVTALVQIAAMVAYANRLPRDQFTGAAGDLYDGAARTAPEDDPARVH